MLKKESIFFIVVIFMIMFFTDLAYAEKPLDWDNNVITAVGYGSPAEGAQSSSQAKILARLAAKTDAQRNLVEIIYGVQIDAETTVKQLMVTGDLIKAQITGFLKGARVIGEKQQADGTYMVVMQVNLYGDNGLSNLIYDTQKIAQQPLPSISENYQPIVGANYTGVVIDATGLPLERCMSPKILDEAGRVIYGIMYVDPEYLSQMGILGYASTPEIFRQLEKGISRAGNNPLKVKALRVENHGYNVVVTKADGDAILAANQRDGFLEKCAVMIKKGGTKNEK